jgi:hypothetical protein
LMFPPTGNTSQAARRLFTLTNSAAVDASS